MSKKPGRRIARKPPRRPHLGRLTPLTDLMQYGPRNDVEEEILGIVISERTALEKKRSLERAALGEKMRVDRTPRKAR